MGKKALKSCQKPHISSPNPADRQGEAVNRLLCTSGVCRGNGRALEAVPAGPAAPAAAEPPLELPCHTQRDTIPQQHPAAPRTYECPAPHHQQDAAQEKSRALVIFGAHKEAQRCLGPDRQAHSRQEQDLQQEGEGRGGCGQGQQSAAAGLCSRAAAAAAGCAPSTAAPPPSSRFPWLVVRDRRRTTRPR